LQARFERIADWPRLARARLKPTADFKAYQAGVAALYAVIAEVSGKYLVVDSSKSPARALAIAGAPGIEVSAVHLVRDGRGCAWSLAKAHARDPRAGVQEPLAGRPVWRSAAGWWLRNLLTERAMRAYPEDRRARVFYEDLVRAPGDVLREVGRVCGLDFSQIARRLEAGEPLRPEHSIAGNRLRMSGGVVLKADEAWRRNLSPAQERVFWLLAGGLARRYGYTRTRP
jgi:hypothetical protein